MARAGFLLFIAVIGLSLSSCEALNNTMESTKDALSSAKETITSIEVPSLSGNAEKATALSSKASGCPSVKLVDDLDQMHLFLDTADPVAKDKVSALRITKLDHTCRHKNSNVIVELDILFNGALGPRARTFKNDRPRYAYPYFIAIENGDGMILAKEIFTTSISYDRTQETITKSENIRQIIPVAPEDNGDDYKILIGFQLTDDELAYNRSLYDRDNDNGVEDENKSAAQSADEHPSLQ